MPSPPEAQSAAAAGLCLACGLCCSGVLFKQATARAEEFEAMEKVGLETFDTGEKGYFKLPCDKLDGCRCTIYETRFRICRTFSCALLDKLKRGEATATEAQHVVAEAKAMLDRADAVDERLRFVDRRMELQKAGPFGGASSPQERAQAAKAYVHMAALERYLDRHFRREGAGMFSYDSLAGEAEAADTPSD